MIIAAKVNGRSRQYKCPERDVNAAAAMICAFLKRAKNDADKNHARSFYLTLLIALYFLSGSRLSGLSYDSRSEYEFRATGSLRKIVCNPKEVEAAQVLAQRYLDKIQAESRGANPLFNQTFLAVVYTETDRRIKAVSLDYIDAYIRAARGEL